MSPIKIPVTNEDLEREARREAGRRLIGQPMQAPEISSPALLRFLGVLIAAEKGHPPTEEAEPINPLRALEGLPEEQQEALRAELNAA